MSKLLKVPICCVCLMLVLADASLAQGWRGIVPLRSTRADVARLYKRLTGASLFGIGLPSDTFTILGEGERVNIHYSLGRCVEGWNVKRDTVISVSVSTKQMPIPLAEMKAELENLPWTEDHGWLSYWNMKDGISYKVYDRKVYEVTYFPGENDRSLACKKGR